MNNCMTSGLVDKSQMKVASSSLNALRVHCSNSALALISWSSLVFQVEG